MTEGAFYTPSLTMYDGRFKAIFRSPGRFPLTKYLNKAGFNYFLLIEESDFSLGDVNEDDTVNSVDALSIARKYVGLVVSSFNELLADINADTVINIVDALLAAQFYVGLIE